MQNLSNSDCPLRQIEIQGMEAKEFGFYWENIHQLIEQIQKELIEIQEAWNTSEKINLQEEIGDLIHVAVSLAIFCKLDPRETLLKSTDKFQKRYNKLIQLVKLDGYENLRQQPYEILIHYWNKAKQAKI